MGFRAEPMDISLFLTLKRWLCDVQVPLTLKAILFVGLNRGTAGLQSIVEPLRLVVRARLCAPLPDRPKL